MVLYGIQLYRGGSGGRNSRIPRRGQDDNGLSFYSSLEELARATNARPKTEWYSIDTGRLVLLTAVEDTRSGKEGHYLLVPETQELMQEWQEMWDTQDPSDPRYEHELAKDVHRAREGMPRGRL